MSPQELLVKEVRALTEGDNGLVGVLANVSAVLHEYFRSLWTGFYLVEGDNLVLGPFQGPVACYRIMHGRGVCGTAWAEDRAIVVPDVEKFPGHIACSSLSRSEIVVPVHNADGRVVAVIDIDDKSLSRFSQDDAALLVEVAEVLQPLFNRNLL